MSDAGLSWTCIKCETINPEAESHCEVCGIERLYRKLEVESLVACKTSKIVTSSRGQYTATPLRHDDGASRSITTETHRSKLYGFIALAVICIAMIGFFLLHQLSHPKNSRVFGKARFDSVLTSLPHPTTNVTETTPANVVTQKTLAISAVESAKRLNNKVSAKLFTLQDQQQRGVLTEANAATARVAMKPLLQEALANSEHAISLDSSNKDAWFQRICTLYFWGKYPEADHYLRQATTKFPDCNDFDPLRPLIEKHLR